MTFQCFDFMTTSRHATQHIVRATYSNAYGDRGGLQLAPCADSRRLEMIARLGFPRYTPGAKQQTESAARGLDRKMWWRAGGMEPMLFAREPQRRPATTLERAQ